MTDILQATDGIMIARDDPHYPGNDPRYADLKPEEIPLETA